MKFIKLYTLLAGGLCVLANPTFNNDNNELAIEEFIIDDIPIEELSIEKRSLDKSTININNYVDELVNKTIDGKYIIKLYNNNTPINKLSNIIINKSSYIYDNILTNELYKHYDKEFIKNIINEKIIDIINSANDNKSKRGYCNIGRSIICRSMNMISWSTCVPWNMNNENNMWDCIKDLGNDYYNCYKECDTEFSYVVYKELKGLIK